MSQTSVENYMHLHGWNVCSIWGSIWLGVFSMCIFTRAYYSLTFTRKNLENAHYINENSACKFNILNNVHNYNRIFNANECASKAKSRFNNKIFQKLFLKNMNERNQDKWTSTARTTATETTSTHAIPAIIIAT